MRQSFYNFSTLTRAARLLIMIYSTETMVIQSHNINLKLLNLSFENLSLICSFFFSSPHMQQFKLIQAKESLRHKVFILHLLYSARRSVCSLCNESVFMLYNEKSRFKGFCASWVDAAKSEKCAASQFVPEGNRTTLHAQTTALHS